jgi:hypothetical protein
MKLIFIFILYFNLNVDLAVEINLEINFDPKGLRSPHSLGLALAMCDLLSHTHSPATALSVLSTHSYLFESPSLWRLAISGTILPHLSALRYLTSAPVGQEISATSKQLLCDLRSLSSGKKFKLQRAKGMAI